MTLTIKEHLLRAADLLETKGWIQEQVKSEKGFCAMGAIYETCELDEVNNDCSCFLCVGVLRKVHEQLSDWNDEPGRTKEEVIALLREEAAKL